MMLKQHLSKNTIAYRKRKGLYNQAFGDSNENLSALILALYNGLVILLNELETMSLPYRKEVGRTIFVNAVIF